MRPGLPQQAQGAIAEIVQRFTLNESAAAQLRQLAELLAHDDLAPTAVRDPVRVVGDHLADSLVALELDAVRRSRTLADIGSGAGVPGLPLAIALPGAQLHLIESNRRRALFIARAADECGIDNVQVVAERVECWGEGFNRCDVVTARAVAAPNVVAEYAAPLLVLGGALVLWRGGIDPRSELEAARAAAVLGLSVHSPQRVEPYRGVSSRHLQVIVKEAPTPARFPRRVGVARKHPLGMDDGG